MMNREAIALEPAYLRLARRLCDQAGALMALDEIQTGFWFPEVLYTGRLGVEPDFIVLGKGMTAGFHPLSALVYRGRLDCLEQYDAISTNGNAALAAYMALGCIALIKREARRIGEIGNHLHDRMGQLCAEFSDVLQEPRGAGHMTGLKFRRVEDALGFQRRALERGLWLRAHAYHAGHSTVLTKFALPLDAEVADFAVEAMRRLLQERAWK
jgi:acetylornithine/succinyldiaminopimelate/putrescine aminotransferase